MHWIVYFLPITTLQCPVGDVVQIKVLALATQVIAASDQSTYNPCGSACGEGSLELKVSNDLRVTGYRLVFLEKYVYIIVVF